MVPLDLIGVTWGKNNPQTSHRVLPLVVKKKQLILSPRSAYSGDPLDKNLTHLDGPPRFVRFVRVLSVHSGGHYVSTKEPKI